MPDRLASCSGQFLDAGAEVARLRGMILEACEVFDHYDLPEHAFHYRRAILGLDEAKKIARGA